VAQLVPLLEQWAYQLQQTQLAQSVLTNQAGLQLEDKVLIKEIFTTRAFP